MPYCAKESGDDSRHPESAQSACLSDQSRICRTPENCSDGMCRHLYLLVAVFLLIELIDRTLRDTTRTRKLTGGIVLGSILLP